MATSAVIRKNDEIFSDVLALRIHSIQILFPIHTSKDGFVCNPKIFHAEFATSVEKATLNPKKKSPDFLRTWRKLV